MIHVQDHCDALIQIIKAGKVGEKYNIGGNCERTNIEIVEKICEVIDLLNPINTQKSHKELIKFVDDRPGHDYRYAVDCSKISDTLNWKPKISFDYGITETVKWYIDHFDWWKKIIQKKYNLERLGAVK